MEVITIREASLFFMICDLSLFKEDTGVFTQEIYTMTYLPQTDDQTGI